MNSKDIVSLYEAYAAVYDEDLRDELESSSIQEDLSFVDDLSDNELDQVMEDIFVSGDIDINECFDSLDYVLSEARVTSSDDRPSGSATVTRSSERPSRAARSAERQRQVRIGRIAQAAQRTGERLAAPARSTGGTSASARVGQASAKVKSAAQKVKGFLGKLGRSAKAGASAAKKELGGEAGREAQERTTGRQMRRAARRQASAERSKDTSEFERKPTWRPGGQNVNRTFKPQQSSAPAAKSDESKPTWRPGGQNVNRTFKPQQGPTPAPKGPRSPAPYRNVGVGKKSDDVSSSPVRALPPVGKTKSGKTLTPQQRGMQTAAQNVRLAKRLGEDFDLLAEMILEDLINEGYAQTFEQAVEVFETFSDYEISQIVENYLVEEREDLYDVVLEHLLDEGYADTVENAEVIMTNMSEEWRDEIVFEGFKKMNRAKIEKQARRLGGDRGDVLRTVADKMDTPVERKYSTRQARLNRAGGAGSEYRKAQELRARDDAKADFKKYGLR
jgi:hypothetical protein